MAKLAHDAVQTSSFGAAVLLLQADKKRRRGVWKGLDVEETDIAFQWASSSSHHDGTAAAASPTICHLRSWAVEGSQTAALVDLSNTWTQRYQTALAVTQQKEMPRMWIASYPAMVGILQSEMLLPNPIQAESVVPKQQEQENGKQKDEV